MSSLIYRVFRKAFPVTVIGSFCYFASQHLYTEVRKDIIKDAKTGEIKDVFVNAWLKEVVLNRVVLKDQDIRKNTLIKLEDIVKDQSFQQKSLGTFTNVMNSPECGQRGKDLSFHMSKTIMMYDKRFHQKGQDVGKTSGNKSIIPQFKEQIGIAEIPKEIEERVKSLCI
ncbi:unnamed protein product [Blepharisma stoltei]|uniref:Uncharacterized protein n=1 Tax=Blepharisma stoltei TaxID=1481888 RepID=A0AAU9JH21_9CILI|nr:unnamed protein product [Blepharisma stoltei]